MMRLLVYRRGGIGDILGLRPLLEAARAGGWEVEGCGDPERWDLLPEGLVSRVHWPERLLGREFLADPGPDRIPSLPFEKIVFFTAKPSHGNPVWSFPAALPPQGENVYAYSARVGHECFGLMAPKKGLEIINTEALLLCPGAGSAAKRWPLDYYLKLASGLPTPPSFLLGPAEPEEWAGRIRSAGFLVLRPEISKLRDLVKSFGTFLGNDSGPAHLAAQEALATCILYGPTDPALWAPPGRVKTLRAPRGDLAALPVDEVLDLLLHRT